MKKEVFEDIIKTEINGKIYVGRRIITGKRVKYQTIYYLDMKDPDSTMYKMDSKARIILTQMVKKYHDI